MLTKAARKKSAGFPAPYEELSRPLNWETGLSLLGYLLAFRVHTQLFAKASVRNLL